MGINSIFCFLFCFFVTCFWLSTEWIISRVEVLLVIILYSPDYDGYCVILFRGNILTPRHFMVVLFGVKSGSAFSVLTSFFRLVRVCVCVCVCVCCVVCVCVCVCVVFVCVVCVCVCSICIICVLCV